MGRELSNLNCDVTWFTRSESPSEVGVVNLSSTLRCQYVVAGPQQHINTDGLFTHLEEFTKHVDASKFDIVLTNYWLSGFVGLLLNLKYGLPQAHIHHSLGVMKYKHVNMPTIGPTRLQIEDLINNRVQCMIHQTDSEWNICKSANPTLIRPGVNVERFQNIDRKKARSILGFEDGIINVLYAGRFAHQKGIQFAVDELASSNVPHKFRLIGSSTCGDLEVSSSDPHVEFLGSKPQNELALYMAASDVLIMPSLYEPFGIVAIEAMAAGCCLIVSAVGDLNEIVKHGTNGLKVPPGNAEAICAAFEKMASDPSMRDDIRTTNIKEAALYSWRITASQIRQEFSHIANNGDPQSVSTQRNLQKKMDEDDINGSTSIGVL